MRLDVLEMTEELACELDQSLTQLLCSSVRCTPEVLVLIALPALEDVPLLVMLVASKFLGLILAALQLSDDM